jgi:hypothetical protein
MIADLPERRALALAPDLPEVTVAYPWGNEALETHGKIWCWRSPYVDAAVFRCDHADREMLVADDPRTYALHPHDAPHPLILVRAGRIDPDRARARLPRQWREAGAA